MSVIKIITINILSDLSLWEKRKSLLVDQLKLLSPDVVALQEVRLPQNPANWLAGELALEHLYLSPKIGREAKRESIAILSRFPFKDTATLYLGGQSRVAQRVIIDVESTLLRVVNGHFYWQPGESAARLRQIERLISWLDASPSAPPTVVCGDFNSTPETRSIQRMKERYLSAYEQIHGMEPEYTCPTPLPHAPWPFFRTFLGFFLVLRPHQLRLNWRGTLDYIFVDPQLRVLDCRLVLDKPSPHNPNLYPSDHLGLYAEIEIC